MSPWQSGPLTWTLLGNSAHVRRILVARQKTSSPHRVSTQDLQTSGDVDGIAVPGAFFFSFPLVSQWMRACGRLERDGSLPARTPSRCQLWMTSASVVGLIKVVEDDLLVPIDR